jgi:hypothetical protein
MPAGWGTNHIGEGRCKHHGGAGGDVGDPGGAPPGEDNGAWEHGGFSEDTDDEAIIQAFQAINTGDLDPVWLQLAGEAYANYRRSGDSRHLAECRKCLENAADDDDNPTLGDIELAADFSD